MFVDRKTDKNGKNWLWYFEWEKLPEGGTVKRPIKVIGPEPAPLPTLPDDSKEVPAICWSFGRTMGNIAVYSPEVLGKFPPGNSGTDALLPCSFVGAGKFRNGVARWWCNVHQAHWGRKADLQDNSEHDKMRCANYAHPMCYIKNPTTFDTNMSADLGIWCSLGPALSSKPIAKATPTVHVHIREPGQDKKKVDENYDAISIRVPGHMKLFGDRHITRINITPPAAFDYLRCKEEGREMVTIECGNCKFPHLDLGAFAQRPHKKHTCGNCGYDHTWSDGPVISNPLQRLHDSTAGNHEFVPAKKAKLNLDDYTHLEFDVWASTPAIVWTAKRPQEVGIHVHVKDGDKEIINDTYAEVIYQGKSLDRKKLYEQMLENTLALPGDLEAEMTM